MNRAADVVTGCAIGDVLRIVIATASGRGYTASIVTARC